MIDTGQSVYFFDLSITLSQLSSYYSQVAEFFLIKQYSCVFIFQFENKTSLNVPGKKNRNASVPISKANFITYLAQKYT